VSSSLSVFVAVHRLLQTHRVLFAVFSSTRNEFSFTVFTATKHRLQRVLHAAMSKYSAEAVAASKKALGHSEVGPADLDGVASIATVPASPKVRINALDAALARTAQGRALEAAETSHDARAAQRRKAAATRRKLGEGMSCVAILVAVLFALNALRTKAWVALEIEVAFLLGAMLMAVCGCSFTSMGAGRTVQTPTAADQLRLTSAAMQPANRHAAGGQVVVEAVPVMMASAPDGISTASPAAAMP